ARIKGTVKVNTVAGATPELLPGARLTLTNRDLPAQVFKTMSDDGGTFIFSDLPAAIFVLRVEGDGLPKVTREINLTSGATLTVEIVMTATLSESVTIRQEEGLLSTSETTTSNTIRSETLNDTPLRAENFQSAALLTPGVVRSNDGLDHLKGARAGQSAYTINGADITDPATGNLAFDLPLEAAANVRVEENPYSAEFGRLTGGATELETKSGSNKFNFTAARFFPTFRHILGGPIDSFRPRVTFSGPIIRDRFFFLQSFEYRFTRARVPSLKAPADYSTFVAFNSFTQFDYKISKNHSAKLAMAFFPENDRFVGLNTFNPQSASPNVTRRGSLFSLSEQAIFGDGSFLDSRLSFGANSFVVSGLRTRPLELLPEGNTGNYFADIRRQSRRLQWQESYYAHPFQFYGEHSFKVGSEIDYKHTEGFLHADPILIRRPDNTLARRIEFVGTHTLSRSLREYSAFAQDRWIITQKFTLDAGVRFDRDALARKSNVAPRLSFIYRPLKEPVVIIRGGVGIFTDRAPLSVGYFAQLPGRVVTTYAEDGSSIIDGPRAFTHVRGSRLRNP
ncbi:MAG TPA: TonB-dependent receptor, partial [Pyrinomonadaceae bacterium]|nr:TonB-dependent receptor [Pyrinomonadaceae bacterium]